MKKQILFIHSAGPQGHDEGSNGLVEYLLAILGNDYSIRHPLMPHPENPRYDAWKIKLKEELENSDHNLILIGHSLGASIILKYLSEENYSSDIEGLFLISTPYWKKKADGIDEFVLTKNFAFRLKKISPIYFYHSKEDQWVPFSHLVDYSKAVPHAIIRKLEGHEHEFGYGLPLLIEDIRQLEKRLSASL
jgi:predicted alpha/beta hydrolase family esterase